MDNDFMQRRARALFLCLMGGEKAITSNAMINAIVTAFEDVRTSALEEAAKVAVARGWQGGGLGQVIAREIRALIPASDGTKENG